MRNKEELKMVRNTVLMTKSLAKDIEYEAQEHRIKVNSVMTEKFEHHGDSLAPSFMAKIQTLANHASKAVQENATEEVWKIQKEANELWTYLNKNA